MNQLNFTESFNGVGAAFLNDSWLKKQERGLDRVQGLDLEALMCFIENSSTIQILTDTSISCITYVLTLPCCGRESPYVSLRRNNFHAPVKKILFKIGFMSFTDKNEYVPFRRGMPLHMDPYNGYMEALSKRNLEKEIIVQDTLFKTTATSAASILEPICPAILCYSLSVSADFKNYLRGQFLGKKRIIDRVGLDYECGDGALNDTQITEGLFSDSVENPIHFIVMEFMDGYCTLDRYIGHPRYTYFEHMMKYEINRMNKLGFMHGDIHPRNVLINPDYPYFTSWPNNAYYGRALIIDFGRTKMIAKNRREVVVGFHGDSGLFEELYKLSSAMSGLFIKQMFENSNGLLFDLVAKLLVQFASGGLEGWRALNGLGLDIGLDCDGDGDGDGDGDEYESIIQYLIQITIEQQQLLDCMDDDVRHYYKMMYQYITELQPRLAHVLHRIKEIGVGNFYQVRIDNLLNAIKYFEMLIKSKMKSINDDFVSRQHDKPSPSYSYRSGGGGGLHFSFRKISIEKIVNGLVRKPVALDLSGEFVCYKVENRDEDKDKDKDKDRFKIDLDAICASIDAESLILFGPKMNLAVEDGFGA